MLSESGCTSRRRRLWDAIPESCQWLLIADPRHVQYLANFWVQPLSFSGGERGLLLLQRDGPATLLGDNFTVRSAAGQPYVDEQIVEAWYNHRTSVGNRDHALARAAAQILERVGGKPGLVEAEWLPLAVAETLQLPGGSRQQTDLGSVLRTLRRRKEADEIALLRECMRATEAGHRRARDAVAIGISELDLYCEIQAAAIAAAGRPALVYGDFRATNAAACKTGGLPTVYQLQDGDLFLLDYSVVLDGYRSDFTNTLAVGRPTREQQGLFDACLAALTAGEAKLAVGAAARDVYAAVSQPLEEAGYGPLTHHAGHGLGLAHPEPPILVPQSDDELMEGDVVTLEPGLYVEGVGGVRIENNYLITKAGCEKLSNHVIAL